MRKSVVFLSAVCLVFLSSFVWKELLFEAPKEWPKPLYNFKANPLSAAKIHLGRVLFYEPLLSRDNTISCSSCHLAQTSFTHVDHDLSHGIEGRIGTRNSPVLVNLAWSKHFMLDGAVHHLDAQSLAPISNPLEMDESIENVVKKLQKSSDYKTLYKQAYGDTIITGERTLKALSQFMLTLVSANAKYDKVLRGEDQFNEYEQKGYILFQKNCASCHSEPLFTNGGFENNGLPLDTNLNDEGRMKITHKESDRGKFKVPTLRNIELSYPYMHDGRFRSLQMVLFHYGEGIEHSSTLAPQLSQKLGLSEDDKRNIIAFLKTLTDETFITNKNYQYINSKSRL